MAQLNATTINGDLTVSGAANIEDAVTTLSNLGLADYIVDQGTSGDWTYIKYNSGLAICEYVATSAVISAISTTAGQLFKSSGVVSVDLPFSMTNNTTFGSFNNGWIYELRAFVTNTALKLVAFNTISVSSVSCMPRAVVIGFWK